MQVVDVSQVRNYIMLKQSQYIGEKVCTMMSCYVLAVVHTAILYPNQQASADTTYNCYYA